MEEFNPVVGTSECPINTIASIIRPEPVIRRDWFTFALELDIPKEKIDKLRQDMLLDKITYSYLIHELLEEWVSRAGADAKLTTLLNVVESCCEANNVGEKLRLKFNLPCKGTDDNNKSIEWAHLSQAFQEKVKATMKQEFPELDTDEVSPKLEGTLLINLMTSQKPGILFRPTVPEKLSYYISRTLITRNIISRKIFDDHSPDIYLFTGMDRNELSRLTKDRLTGSSREQLRGDVTSKFILLDQANHFEKICQKSKQPVHLLRKEGGAGSFKWIKSSGGGLENLRGFVDAAQKELDQESFCQNMEDQTMTVCISDSPGMGKSVLLGEIGRRMSQLYPDRIVLFIRLGEFIKLAVGQLGVAGTREDAFIKALASTVCENILGHYVLQSKLKSDENGVLIELLLDGFDEINSVEYNLTLVILNTFTTSFKSTRVWVTSRLHLLKELEVSLNLFGYKIREFNSNDQVRFLSSYWSRMTTLDQDITIKFAEHCLRSLKSTMKSADQDIAGIPLQCLLIGEVYEEDAMAYAGLDKDDSPPPIEIETIAILELYQSLVKIKILKYGSAYGQTKLTEQQLISVHVYLSVRLIFPEDVDNLRSVFGSNPGDGEMEEVLKVGILESTSTAEAPRFMHRTFAEYFIAWFMDQRLENGWTKELHDFFKSRILECRQCILLHEDNLYSKRISSHRFNQTGVCYFLNWFIAETSPRACRSFPVVLSDFQNPVSESCAMGDLFQLFKFLDDWLKVFISDGIVIVRSEVVLLAIEHSSLELIKLVLVKFQKYQEFDLDMQKKALHKAVKRSNYTIVEFLLKEKGLGSLLIMEERWGGCGTLVHSCVTGTKDDSNVQLKNKKDVLKMLLEINGSLLESYDGFGPTPLLSRDVHVQLLIELVHLGADIFAADDNDRTVLHWGWGREHLTNHDYHLLLMSIPEDKLKEVVQRDSAFRMDNYPISEGYKEILWSHLINHDLLPETLDMLRGAGVNFNLLCHETFPVNQDKSSDFEGDDYVTGENDSVTEGDAVNDLVCDSILAVAIKNGRNPDTVRKLIQLGADIGWKRATKGETLLHLAVLWNNRDAVELLMDEYKIDVNVMDNDGLTPLDYAIESSYLPPLDIHGNFSFTYCDICHALQERGGKFKEILNSEGHSWLHVAVLKCRFDTVKVLVQLGIDVMGQDSDGNTVLHLSVVSEPPKDAKYIEPLGYFRIVQHLLENGADPQILNNNGDTPFEAALKEQLINLQTFQLLKSKTVVAWNPLLAALAIKFAIEKEEEFDDEQLNLHFNECEAIRANLNWTDDKGDSLLHMAARKWRKRTIRFLVGRGVNVNSTNSLGQTPLHLAVIYEHRVHLLLLEMEELNPDLELFQCLLDKGADPKLKDKNGASLLHLAAAYGSAKTLKFILDLRVLDMNEKDKEGNTALHYTLLEHKHYDNEKRNLSPPFVLDKCTFLLEKGADVNLPNNDGFSPLEIVTEEEPDYYGYDHYVPTKYAYDVVELFKWYS